MIQSFVLLSLSSCWWNNSNERRGLLVTCPKNDKILGKSHNWDCPGQGSIPAGGFWDSDTATYRRISWQKDFPAENHPTNKFPIFYGKWIVLGKIPPPGMPGRKSFKVVTESLLRFFFLSPHQNFDVIREIITKTGRKIPENSQDQNESSP